MPNCSQISQYITIYCWNNWEIQGQTRARFFFQIHLNEDKPWIWAWKNLIANSEIFWFCCDMSERNICALQVFYYIRITQHVHKACITPSEFMPHPSQYFLYRNTNDVHSSYTPYQSYQNKSQKIYRHSVDKSCCKSEKWNHALDFSLILWKLFLMFKLTKSRLFKSQLHRSVTIIESTFT